MISEMKLKEIEEEYHAAIHNVLINIGIKHGVSLYAKEPYRMGVCELKNLDQMHDENNPDFKYPNSRLILNNSYDFIEKIAFMVDDEETIENCADITMLLDTLRDRLDDCEGKNND